MRTPTASSVDRSELPAMVATLCSYEDLFGPCHPQTLCLAAQVAAALWHHGHPEQGRPLLERTVRDLGRSLGRYHELRVRAVRTLRDLLLAECSYERAAVVQKELLECQTQRLGPADPETLATQSDLATILLSCVEQTPGKEV